MVDTLTVPNPWLGLGKMSEGAAPAMWKSVVAGSFAGLCEILVMYPTDVAKTR